MKAVKDGWTKKFKGDRERGGAWIYTHPEAKNGRAVVENHNGVSFDGRTYSSLDDAQAAALKGREE